MASFDDAEAAEAEPTPAATLQAVKKEKKAPSPVQPKRRVTEKGKPKEDPKKDESKDEAATSLNPVKQEPEEKKATWPPRTHRLPCQRAGGTLSAVSQLPLQTHGTLQTHGSRRLVPIMAEVAGATGMQKQTLMRPLGQVVVRARSLLKVGGVRTLPAHG